MTAESYEALPQNVKDIVDSWDEENNDKYNESSRIVDELEAVGWTAEYGLCGEIHSVVKKRAYECITIQAEEGDDFQTYMYDDGELVPSGEDVGVELTIGGGVAKFYLLDGINFLEN